MKRPRQGWGSAGSIGEAILVRSTWRWVGLETWWGVVGEQVPFGRVGEKNYDDDDGDDDDLVQVDLPLLGDGPNSGFSYYLSSVHSKQ